jgi:hypothetical protein
MRGRHGNVAHCAKKCEVATAVEGQPWVPDGSTMGPRFLGGNRGFPHKNCQPLTLSHLESDGGPTASMPSAARPRQRGPVHSRPNFTSDSPEARGHGTAHAALPTGWLRAGCACWCAPDCFAAQQRRGGTQGAATPEGARCRGPPPAWSSLRERVLFIGTQCSILYTSMYSPAGAAVAIRASPSRPVPCYP